MNTKFSIVTSAADVCGKPSSVQSMDNAHRSNMEQKKESFMLFNHSSVVRGSSLMAAAIATMAFVGVASANTVTPANPVAGFFYNYSPWDGITVDGGTASGTSLSIPTVANASSSDLYVQTGFVASGTYGISNSTTNSDTLTWDFQAPSGQAFGSGFSFSAGGLNGDHSSTMTGAYSTDNGTTYTTFYNNDNAAQGLDSTQSVSDVNLNGATNLLVQFTLQDSAPNQAAFFWGSSDPMNRAFMLSGTMIGTTTTTPEPASLALLGLGAVSLLLITRKRKTA